MERRPFPSFVLCNFKLKRGGRSVKGNGHKEGRRHDLWMLFDGSRSEVIEEETRSPVRGSKTVKAEFGGKGGIRQREGLLSPSRWVWTVPSPMVRGKFIEVSPRKSLWEGGSFSAVAFNVPFQAIGLIRGL